MSLNPTVFDHFILLGDFNVNYFCSSSSLYSHLTYSLTPFHLTQMVTSGTHVDHSGNSTLIDLVFVSDICFVTFWSLIPPLGNSDHNGIEIRLHFENSDEEKVKLQRKVWCFGRADYSKMRQMINSFNWSQILTKDISLSVLMWQKHFLHILEECIPRKTLSMKQHLPFITKHLLILIKKRNSLFKLWKKSGDHLAHLRYKLLRNRLVALLRTEKRKYFQNLNIQESKSFWRIVRQLKPKSQSIPTLCNGTTYGFTSQEKANTLSSFFMQCFNYSTEPLSFADMDTLGATIDCPEEFLCTVDEVRHLLEALDTKKSTGPDEIPAKILKIVASNIAPSVTKLFNLSIGSGLFPISWKSSNIVAIPKSSEMKNPSNYRPISLLSIISKMLERHVSSLISEHLLEHNIISDEQWGFTSKKSTTTALLTLTHEWLRHLEAGMEVCVIFLDLKKAFDSVPHRDLLMVVKSTGLHPILLRWLCSYLSARSQRVVVGGVSSSEVHAVSGVPQGSVLGPLLFKIYINSITDLKLTTGSKLMLYADDVILYRPISKTEEYSDVQKDLNTLNVWSNSSRLLFNPLKCKYMVITRKKANSLVPPIITLGSSVIERTYSYKYLGVTISSDLSWSEHIHIICTKARKTIGLLYRHFYLNSNTPSLLQLYLTLV